jgi:two-component system response regulator AtoC
VMKFAIEGPSRAALEASPSEAPSLLVVGDSGVFSRPLPAKGEVTLGRSDECDVVIDDPKLSRRHLLIRTGDGGAIEVVDLGSANGTILDEVKLAPNVPVAIGMGATLTVASTVVIVRTRGQASRACGLVSHAELSVRLGVECDRAAATMQAGEAFALVKVHVPGVRDTDALEGVLGDALRKSDVVAAVAPGMYVVLLHETSPTRADAVASRVASLLERRGMDASLQVAVYPRDGDTPALLEGSAGTVPSRRQVVRSDGVVFAGKAMQALDAKVDELAASTTDVIVLGETGVGKETIARAIHARSAFANAPFIRIDCGSLDEPPAELFVPSEGGDGGTLAVGTIFLHELGEMTLEVQAKLLQTLERRDRRNAGTPRGESADANDASQARAPRILSSTSGNLEAACFQGRFQELLLRRLDGARVVVPPLRARVDDIEPLAKAFAKAACAAIGKKEEIRISAPAMVLLKHHAWPDNVRELREVIERAVLLVKGDAITLEHLPCEQLAPAVSVRDAWVPPGLRPRVVRRTG